MSINIEQKNSDVQADAQRMTDQTSEKRVCIPKPVEVRLKKVNAHLVSLVTPGSPEAERYRSLRHAVEQTHTPGKCTVVGVCSPIPGDGKSITAINVAGALAQDPQARVLLMEVDLRRPSVTIGDHLAINDIKAPGLVDAVKNPKLGLNDVLRRVTEFNLDVLRAGGRPSAPYEVLSSPRFGELLAEVRRHYDYVVLDAPPVVPVPDCRLIAQWVDGFLVVVAAHRTPRGVLEEALNALRPEAVLGLVYNGDDGPAARKYGYYAYGYDLPSGRNRRPWWRRLSGR